MSTPSLILVHSPLAGPLTWRFVASELFGMGLEGVVVALPYAAELKPPYWSWYAAAIQAGLDGMPRDRPVVLVAHGAAGPLLPAMRKRVANAVRGYLFVDADLPGSRIRPPRAARGAAHDPPLEWAAEQIEAAIPNARMRARFLAEMRPWPLALFAEEPAPVFGRWPDAPCAYLDLSGDDAVHGDALAAAEARGWPVARLARSAGHFAMLDDPGGVARELAALLAAIAGDAVDRR